METGEDRQPKARVSTGVSGLDEILPGGFPAHRLYLIEGMPGTGKTTLALQFLLEGRRAGERGLYVTLSETKEELQEVSESHGWSLDGIDLYELGSSEARLKPEQEYTVFHPEEIELAKPLRASTTRSSASSQAGWCSIHSPRCGCWRVSHFATGVRF